MFPKKFSINDQRLPFDKYKRCAKIVLCCKSGRIGLIFLWRIGIIMHFHSCKNSSIENLFKQEYLHKSPAVIFVHISFKSGMWRLLKSRNVLDRQNFKSFHEKGLIFKSLYTSNKRYICNHFKKHDLHLVNKVQKNGKFNISPRKRIFALSASLNYQTCSFFMENTATGIEIKG